MIAHKLSEVAAILRLPPPQRDVVIESIATDSRKVRYGALFAALPGSQVDGHDYAAVAAETGAVALLVQRHVDLPVQTSIPQLVVGDVLVALSQIAKSIRDRVGPVVAGITGSNGKTTVKEMLASILRQQNPPTEGPSTEGPPTEKGVSPVLATQGNYNNELGLPLTLFRLEPQHRYAVLELGATKAGDIAWLASLAQPKIGVITNVGPAHLEGFGSLEGVARAKGELYASLPADGCAVINGDERWEGMWRSLSTASRILTFGVGKNCEVRVTAGDGSPCMRTPFGNFDVRLRLPGEHNLVNAAAATAAALALDVPLANIELGLQAVEPVPGRLYLMHSDSGWTVIDDTYNANPASLYSALNVLAGMQGTAWLVLGDMKELGEDSAKMHAEVGDAARALGVSRIFATGDLAALTVETFGAGARHFADKDTLLTALKTELRPGINCLVKGSRSMGMENIVQAIVSAKNIKDAC